MVWRWSFNFLSHFKRASNRKNGILPFKRQSHKMVKYTQTIRRQIADELFECVWPLCEIVALKVNTE